MMDKVNNSYKQKLTLINVNKNPTPSQRRPVHLSDKNVKVNTPVPLKAQVQSRLHTDKLIVNNSNFIPTLKPG
jgi:hypothetical protein